MSKKNEISQEAFEKAIQKARDEYEDFKDSGESDYIGNRAAFILWQYLGGIDVPEDFRTADYKPFVKRFYEVTEGLICDEYGELLTSTEVWAQFVEVCECNKVKYFKNNRLQKAIERAQKRTEPLPELADYDPQHQFLGAVCSELQEMAGDKPFFLSGYDAGDILGKGQKTGRKALIMFCADEILRLIKVGTRTNASEYRYIGGKARLRRKNHRQLTPQEIESRKQKVVKSLKALSADKEPEKEQGTYKRLQDIT